MAGQTRVPDQGALHSELLPAPRSDRAVMGTDASPRDPQPKPPELQRLLPIRSAFLRVEVPKNWAVFCDSVTDNFRVINPADFRVLKA